MDSTEITHATFPFRWIVKATSYNIQYRKAESTDDIDEIFCSIINAKGNKITVSELGDLLGFNLQDDAERDILNIYLERLSDYSLIVTEEDVIQLTEPGQESLQAKLKYKYYWASTELFENLTAHGESVNFSFRTELDLENSLSNAFRFESKTSDNTESKQKLQPQLFGDDIFKGEIVDLIESYPSVSYKDILLQCEILPLGELFQVVIYKSGVRRSGIERLIDLPQNEQLKSELVRKGMYHQILIGEDRISIQNIESYIDLWDWKDLAKNDRTDWSDKNIFELFRENGDGSVWNTISEKAPIECIETAIQQYAEYWNWTALTERFNDNYIEKHINNFDWDFEELSFKKTELVTRLLSNLELKDHGWNWNYLSRELPEEFIKKNIDRFPWDFYEITIHKSDVFKNVFINNRDNVEALISRSWDWKFISTEINIKFLRKNLAGLASKLDWHTVMDRLFNDEEMISKCLRDESFKVLLNIYLPDNFIIAHQKYLWTPRLIYFFEQQNLIQWETKPYINGFDTNENVVWDKSTFQKFHDRITTEQGLLNISERISDYELIEEYPDFVWNWEGISKNKNLFVISSFVENAFTGKFSFSNKLHWNEILSQPTFDVAFWNKNLNAFLNNVNSEEHGLFWNLLTQKESFGFILRNNHFPWDWSHVTEIATEDIIRRSIKPGILLAKWDWTIATRKLDKRTVLDELEKLADFVDWGYLIDEVFTIENELSLNKQLPRLAACLSVVDADKRKNFWRALTAKFPYELLFPILEATISLDIFEWDWDYVSNHKLLPTDVRTLRKFEDQINWAILTESDAIKNKFDPKTWTSGEEWFANVNRYLQHFKDKWDWQLLSRNKNINYNRSLLSNYSGENWDWEYLSAFGGFLKEQKRDRGNQEYLANVVKEFPNICYNILSKRKDIVIDSDLIRSNSDKSWDWNTLSGNEKAEISKELILELRDKYWNWAAIAGRINDVLDNETVLILMDKSWDWGNLSKCVGLDFNPDFIQRTRTKTWDWKAVSRHNTFSPNMETITLTKAFDLDWDHLSLHSKLVPNEELLLKFEDKWNWKNITRNPKIDFSDSSFVARFAERWDWSQLCGCKSLTLNHSTLSKFEKFLDWDLISANTNIAFTEEIVREFRPYWNWTKLKENWRVRDDVGDYVLNFIKQDPAINFLDKINEQHSRWKGKIYHFSHIDNAVSIIRDRKVKSRKTANQISDSAGNVVYTRSDAHSYARFYFRPHTQTQFYNEYLGIDLDNGFMDKTESWHSWYETEYRRMDFPKCPKPIYFEFDLQEVLLTKFEKCNISTGNMQKEGSKFGKINDFIHLFNFEDLFIYPGMDREEWKKFREFAQQEFMVEEELDFSQINSLRIICANDQDRDLLIQLLGMDSIDLITKIIVDQSYYRNENPPVMQFVSEDEIRITCEKKASGHFILTYGEHSNIEITDGDVIKEGEQRIIFKSYIRIKNHSKSDELIVKYVDEIDREWLVFSNYELPSREFENIRGETKRRKQSILNHFPSSVL